jgi:hypothetical protein
MSSITSLIKLDTVHLYIDIKKKIMTFDVLNSVYSKENTITVLEYFKNFWLLVQEQNSKYFLIIKINSIGVYPLSFYSNLITVLSNLDNIFKNHLHSCVFICKDNNPLLILKPLFTSYKLTRPYNIRKTYEEALIFFNEEQNQV